MECPFCGGATQVKDSRPMADGIRRRRECVECKGRFTTHERLAPAEVRVTKLSGRSEPFERANIERVIRRVTRDTDVTAEAIAAAVRFIEADLHRSGRSSIDSWELVGILADQLARLHPDARRRFLANYTDTQGNLVRPRRRGPVDEGGQIALFAVGTEDEEPS
ncbi:MAG TPA: ATP cone domain-containing protein [Thermoanaerobaculia bacterium]|nr:ATP cone domain-containing protein [Thermoanaerobaculia bacterium]